MIVSLRNNERNNPRPQESGRDRRCELIESERRGGTL